jgi:hypothetical protein
MDVCLLCLYVVLSCVGRGLRDGPIIRPEESYRVSNSVWLRNLNTEEAKARFGLLSHWMDGWMDGYVALSWARTASNRIGPARYSPARIRRTSAHCFRTYRYKRPSVVSWHSGARWRVHHLC